MFEFYLVAQSLLMMEGPEEIFVNTYSAMKAYQTDTSGFRESIRPLHIINAQSTLRNLECGPTETLYFRADARDAKINRPSRNIIRFLWCHVFSQQ